MTEKRNNLFDLLRVLFAVSVVISHASGKLYHGDIVSANVAVDGFFMLSGLFMAKHLYAHKNENTEQLFLNYQIGRISRLVPMYVISCIYGILFDAIFFHSFNAARWPAVYLLGDINGIPGFWATWYVCCLFWAGLLVSTLLVWQRKKAVLVFFPLIFFFSFSYMYSYHHLWLYAKPLISGFLSVGLVKALCALVVGAECFYASLWLKERLLKIKVSSRRFVAVLCELMFLVGFASSFKIGFSPANFIVYLYVPLILLVFLLDEQVIFRVLDRKIFAFLGKMTYAVYLTHLYLLTYIENTGVCKAVPPVLTYIVLIPITFFIGWIFCKIEKIFLCAVRKFFLNDGHIE